MTTALKSDFVVGAEVAIFSDDKRSVEKTRVAKLYANGNFIVEGDKHRRQWRAFGQSYAHLTGDGYLRPTCRLINEATREMIDDVERAQRWRSFARKISACDPTKVSWEAVKAAEQLVALLLKGTS